jgi:hypothetical protein
VPRWGKFRSYNSLAALLSPGTEFWSARSAPLSSFRTEDISRCPVGSRPSVRSTRTCWPIVEEHRSIQTDCATTVTNYPEQGFRYSTRCTQCAHRSICPSHRILEVPGCNCCLPHLHPSRQTSSGIYVWRSRSRLRQDNRFRLVPYRVESGTPAPYITTWSRYYIASEPTSQWR